MVLTKVSGDLISIISETGATSSFAATLGRRFYSKQAEKYAYDLSWGRKVGDGS